METSRKIAKVSWVIEPPKRHNMYSSVNDYLLNANMTDRGFGVVVSRFQRIVDDLLYSEMIEHGINYIEIGWALIILGHELNLDSISNTMNILARSYHETPLLWDEYETSISDTRFSWLRDIDEAQKILDDCGGWGEYIQRCYIMKKGAE